MGRNADIKKPPEQYVEGFVKYTPGIDTNPNLLDLILRGFSYEDADRILKLFAIEAVKYHLREAVEDGEGSEEEIAEVEAEIAKMIDNYNKAS